MQETGIEANSLEQLQRRFEEYRNIRPSRGRLPAELWKEAAEVARRYRLNPTAQALRLDYNGLKKCMAVAPAPIKQGKQVHVAPWLLTTTGANGKWNEWYWTARIPCSLAIRAAARTVAILSSLTSTCRRHNADPQLYPTQLLTNLRLSESANCQLGCPISGSRAKQHNRPAAITHTHFLPMWFTYRSRIFGFTKVRYRGIAKNHHWHLTAFALVNLYQHRIRPLVITARISTAW
jgi:hypothetical protein